VTRTLQPRLAVYLATGAVALLAGAALKRPALVATGAPFVLFVLGGLLAERRPTLGATIEVTPARVVEGDRVTVTVDAGPYDATLLLPPALGGPARLDAPTRELTPAHWGGYAIGPVRVTNDAAWGLVTYTADVGVPAALRVYPRPETLPRPLTPRDTRPAPGAIASRALGEGLEYDGLRPLAPGEPARRVNWRATARTGRLYTTQRTLERAADVVLFLDTFAALGGTLEQAVRAADALAARHLARGDRVGVVSFGGFVQWLRPEGGRRARARIVETLIESEVVFSYALKDVSILPRRALPAHALVIGVTPLLDDRGVRALLDLRGRGFDVAALVLPPFAALHLEPRADRLWRLRHDALRRRLEHAGIATAIWDPDAPLAAPVSELERCRRAA